MRRLFIALSLISAAALPAHAQSVEDFYRGKTVSLVVGFSVGGGYDLYARHLARHLGKHIPGNPTVLPQNMPGAGSLKAANYIYTAAPKDGSAIGMFARATGINPLLESGATAPNGKLPINPSGGFLSFGEATTAQGIFQVCELGWQLRGEAGGRQVPDAKVGLGQTLGLGGNGAAVILKR